VTNWFEEKLEIGLGKTVKIEYKNLIESFQSKFQKIDIYDTIPFGKMLVHDDVIMLTEADEAHYHEMISHVAMNVHPAPENILVIGGGDGGAIREVLRHKDVKSVHLCEIDGDVVRLCRKHFPGIGSGLDNEKVEIFYEDGAEFIRKRKNFYQVIIVDSSDPIGPAEVLFQEKFYKSMYDALSDDGIVITQSESFLYHRKIIGEIASFSRKIFPGYYYYYTLVPTYPSGLIGFSFCSKKYHPLTDFKEERAAELTGLRYYTPEIHNASFVLPLSFREFLKRR
jgi:spermidine synthase